MLCYILLLHQTTTERNAQEKMVRLCYILLLHQTTTKRGKWNGSRWLCYILLLHQTTTPDFVKDVPVGLCYILLLHQTTTRIGKKIGSFCCVISYFYIKPQLIRLNNGRVNVVLYLTSTSNHNHAI